MSREMSVSDCVKLATSCKLRAHKRISKGRSQILFDHPRSGWHCAYLDHVTEKALVIRMPDQSSIDVENDVIGIELAHWLIRQATMRQSLASRKAAPADLTA